MDGLSASELSDLRRYIVDYFRRAGLDAHVDRLEAGLADGRRFGLVNLFQAAARLPAARRPAYLRWHFDTLLRIDTDLDEDYGAVSTRLRIRILTERASSLHPDQTRRRLCAGLWEVLMVRFESGCFSLPVAALSGWDVPPARVWDDARTHTLGDEPHELRVLVERSRRVHWITGSFYSSSVLPVLGTFLPEPLPQGAVVMAPTVDSLLVVPLDRAFSKSVESLLEIGLLWWRTGPHSLSTDLFWWSPRGVERIARGSQQGFVPCWSAEFSTALRAAGSHPPP